MAISRERARYWTNCKWIEQIIISERMAWIHHFSGREQMKCLPYVCARYTLYYNMTNERERTTRRMNWNGWLPNNITLARERSNLNSSCVLLIKSQNGMNWKIPRDWMEDEEKTGWERNSARASEMRAELKAKDSVLVFFHYAKCFFMPSLFRSLSLKRFLQKLTHQIMNTLFDSSQYKRAAITCMLAHTKWIMWFF